MTNCEDCPPAGYPTDKTRCAPCPRRITPREPTDEMMKAGHDVDGERLTYAQVRGIWTGMHDAAPLPYTTQEQGESGTMTDITRSNDLTGDHTPGPWGWFGSTRNGNRIYLATVHRGRRFVMGFKRKGMAGAEPTFQINHRMVPASDLAIYEVCPEATDAKDDRVYRHDIVGLRSADARLIAAAPDLLAALLNVRQIITDAALTGFNCNDGDWAERLFASQRASTEAIIAATGSTLRSPVAEKSSNAEAVVALSSPPQHEGSLLVEALKLAQPYVQNVADECAAIGDEGEGASEVLDDLVKIRAALASSAKHRTPDGGEK